MRGSNRIAGLVGISKQGRDLNYRWGRGEWNLGRGGRLRRIRLCWRGRWDLCNWRRNFGWRIGWVIVFGFVGSSFLRGWVEGKIGRFASIGACLSWLPCCSSGVLKPNVDRWSPGLSCCRWLGGNGSVCLCCRIRLLDRVGGTVGEEGWVEMVLEWVEGVLEIWSQGYEVVLIGG